MESVGKWQITCSNSRAFSISYDAQTSCIGVYVRQVQGDNDLIVNIAYNRWLFI